MYKRQEVNRRVAVAHFAERFLYEIFPVPDRRAAAQPAGFLVVGLAPVGPRVGRLLFALEIFPLATPEDEAVSLVRGVAAHGGFPVVAVVVVDVVFVGVGVGFCVGVGVGVDVGVGVGFGAGVGSGVGF